MFGFFKSDKEQNITDGPGFFEVNTIKDRDPDFSESMFREKAVNLFIRLYNCESKKDIEGVSPYIERDFFEKYSSFFHRKESNERVAVLDANVKGRYEKDDYDHIIIDMKVRAGDSFDDLEFDFCRCVGLKTIPQSKFNAQNCPHCGAPVNINRTARCEYCDSILDTDNFNWKVFSLIKK